MEQTLVMIKPDAVQRHLAGRILARFERKGLKVVALKMLTIEVERARRMYAVHEGKEFLEGLITFMTRSPVVALVLDGTGVIDVVRTMIGPTFGPDAPAGTIRGDFGMSRRYNLIHASDSAESARREIGILFEPGEMQDYSFADGSWIDETSGTPSAKPRGTFPEETERKRNTLGARLDQPAGTTRGVDEEQETWIA